MNDRSPLSAASPASKKPRAVFLLDDFVLEKIYGAEECRALSERLDFVAPRQNASNFEPNHPAYAEVEVIVSGWGMPTMDTEFLSHFPKLGVVFYGAGSVRSFVTDASWARGVRVVSAAAVNAIPVAEFTFAQVVLALKRVFPQAAAVRRHRRFLRQGEPIPGAYRSIVGLLSLGEIGQRVAKWLKLLEVEVIAFDPHVSPKIAETLGVSLCSLEDIFKRADVVSCHTPWLPSTERMLRGRHFELLKPGATFINTARGAVVAEDEMIEVLRRRPDLFAALDVVYPDPPASESALFDLPNVLLTPHIAGSVDGECVRMGRKMIEELDRYLRGEPFEGEITRERADALA